MTDQMTDARAWLLQLMGNYDFTVPTLAFDEIAARLRTLSERCDCGGAADKCPGGCGPQIGPSYEALDIIVRSVCGALERAGVNDCDDPGEAIDVLREKLEARITALSEPADLHAHLLDMLGVSTHEEAGAEIGRLHRAALSERKYTLEEMERFGLSVADAREKRLSEQQGEAVAYLDIGVGGYMDVGTDLTNEQLAALPKGRHMLGIIGTHGVDGYTRPQPAAGAHNPACSCDYHEGLEEGLKAGRAEAQPAAGDFGAGDFAAYLSECDHLAIQPDIAGAFHAGWTAARLRNLSEPTGSVSDFIRSLCELDPGDPGIPSKTLILNIEDVRGVAEQYIRPALSEQQGDPAPIAHRTIYPDGSYSAWGNGPGLWPEKTGFAGGSHGWQYAWDRPQPTPGDGPDHSDGCDHEGFDGGCARAGHDPAFCTRKPAAGDAVRLDSYIEYLRSDKATRYSDPSNAAVQTERLRIADELEAALPAALSTRADSAGGDA